MPAVISVSYCCFVSTFSYTAFAAGYGVDGPGIESWWGGRFSTPIENGRGAYPAFCTMGTGFFFPGAKRPTRGVNHPPPSSAEVKERVNLYLLFSLDPYGLL